MNTELQKLIEMAMLLIYNDENAMQSIEKNGADPLLTLLSKNIHDYILADYDVVKYDIDDDKEFVAIATVWINLEEDVELYMMTKAPDETFPEMVERIALED